MKTLIAKHKTKEQAKKQIKRWFSRNPNRKIVNIHLTTGVTSVARENYISQN